MKTEYHKLPSYKLVLVIKDCKALLEARPDYADRLKNTIAVVKRILIDRQVIG